LSLRSPSTSSTAFMTRRTRLRPSCQRALKSCQDRHLGRLLQLRRRVRSGPRSPFRRCSLVDISVISFGDLRGPHGRDHLGSDHLVTASTSSSHRSSGTRARR
jgi:hypothetical protein